MENAGSGSFLHALELRAGSMGAVWCVAGPGNNGGDALVVARHLAVVGVPVRIALLPVSGGSGSHGDAAVQREICRAMEIPTVLLSDDAAVRSWADSVAGASLLVDGLFGTGLSRELAGVPAQVVGAINASSCPVLALDLPSGLDADSGHALGACVRADATATFVAPKLGFSAPGAAAFTGVVHVVGIGAPFADLL